VDGFPLEYPMYEDSFEHSEIEMVVDWNVQPDERYEPCAILEYLDVNQMNYTFPKVEIPVEWNVQPVLKHMKVAGKKETAVTRLKALKDKSWGYGVYFGLENNLR